MRSHRQGFTLIEMSIVLVIIGLLVGGIMVGQGMIQAQRVRQVLTDAKTYATAIQQFQDKYGSLPGDMKDAERVFGNAEGGAVGTDCATPATSASPDGIKTCNGNGNGIYDTGTIGWYEGFWAWQQLKAAGFIQGTYTGISNNVNGYGAIAGLNVPAGSITNSAYWLDGYGVYSGADTRFFPGDYSRVMTFGGQSSAYWPKMPILTPGEAYEIDKKSDDGIPGTGSIRTFANTWMTANTGTCVTSDDATTATYATTSAAPGCILLFMSTFDQKISNQ